jgi:hypothetical protein
MRGGVDKRGRITEQLHIETKDLYQWYSSDFALARIIF